MHAREEGSCQHFAHSLAIAKTPRYYCDLTILGVESWRPCCAVLKLPSRSSSEITAGLAVNGFRACTSGVLDGLTFGDFQLKLSQPAFECTYLSCSSVARVLSPRVLNLTQVEAWFDVGHWERSGVQRPKP